MALLAFFSLKKGGAKPEKHDFWGNVLFTTKVGKEQLFIHGTRSFLQMKYRNRELPRKREFASVDFRVFWG